MISLRNVAFPGLFGLVWLLAMAGPAYGYIDPGTGSFVIQVLIGSALGSLLALKIFWRKIIGFVGRLFGRKPDRPPAEPQAASQTEPHHQEGSQDA